jgi:hypothetical protein
MPNVKMLSPNTKIVFIPFTGVANPDAGPTLAECQAGVDISCAIVTGYTLNPTDPDTDDTSSICDEGNVVNPTYDNYELDVTFFRDDNLADAASVYNIAYGLFGAGPVVGWWVRRTGKKAALPFVATDRIDYFGFETDYVAELDARNAPQQFSLKGIPNGYLDTFKTI